MFSWRIYIPKILVVGVTKPRYVRVNTLKLDVDAAMVELGKEYAVRVTYYHLSSWFNALDVASSFMR